MADHRVMHSVLTDLETVGLDLRRLSIAVVLLGRLGKLEDLDRDEAGAIEVVGEVIEQRVVRFDGLLREAFDLNRAGDA